MMKQLAQVFPPPYPQLFRDVTVDYDGLQRIEIDPLQRLNRDINHEKRVGTY